MGAEGNRTKDHAIATEEEKRAADPAELVAEMLARVGEEPANSLISQQGGPEHTPERMLDTCLVQQEPKPAEAAGPPARKSLGRKQRKRSKTRKTVPDGDAQVCKSIAVISERQGLEELAEPDPFSFPGDEDEPAGNDANSLASLPAVNDTQQRRQAAREVATAIAIAEQTLDQGRRKSSGAASRLAATAIWSAKGKELKPDRQVEAKTGLASGRLGEKPDGVKLRKEEQGAGAAAQTTSRQTPLLEGTGKETITAVQGEVRTLAQRRVEEQAGTNNAPGSSDKDKACSKSSFQQTPAAAVASAIRNQAITLPSSSPAEAVQPQAISAGRKRCRKGASEQEGTPQPALAEDSAGRRQREDPPKAAQNILGRKRQFSGCHSRLEAAAATPDGTWGSAGSDGGGVAEHADSAGRSGRRERGRQENKKPWWVV